MSDAFSVSKSAFLCVLLRYHLMKTNSGNMRQPACSLRSVWYLVGNEIICWQINLIGHEKGKPAETGCGFYTNDSYLDLRVYFQLNLVLYLLAISIYISDIQSCPFSHLDLD